MKYNSVTIWHKTNDGYKRIFFEKASVIKTLGVEGGASGELENNSAALRVYTLYDCGVVPGDRLIIGYDEALTPPIEAYKIMQITDYFNVSAPLRHYKIICR